MLIDCQIDCDEKVWPMVAPGAAIDQVFDEGDLVESKFHTFQGTGKFLDGKQGGRA